MCGICGKLSFTRSDVEHAALSRMCGHLVRRGPDHEGIHISGRAGLAQRRLSIIDLQPGATAPLSNEDGTIWVTFNGEIYNFQELRVELSARGHVFRTATDTEVIVHLYEEYDVECLSRLRGMFAFAIWDAPRRRLFAARDRLGKKPFFYARTAASFVFASSIAALRSDPDVSMVPNYGALDAFLTYQYVPSPGTAFEGISKLPPGHYLTCGPEGDLEVRRYWRPPLMTHPGKVPPDSGELESEILHRLSEAVRLRMVADVPLGAFLSGGVDSSAIVALMAQASAHPVKTFSIGFEEQDFDELPFARRIAERYATDHHEFIVRPDATGILPELVREYGEPFADSSALPTYYLSKLTRDHVTVALSGDGGDETFGGYDTYRVVSAWHRADRVPRAVRRAFDATVGGAMRQFSHARTPRRLAHGSAMLAAPLEERFRLQSSIFKPHEKQAAYTPKMRALITEATPYVGGPESVELPSGVDPVDWMMWHDLQYYLPDCLMVKVDVASMAHGLEVRSPFLDHHFVEFAATIPPRLKQDAAGGKKILKRALSRLLPEEVLQRKKKGFGVPLRWWFGRDLLDHLRGTLLDDRALRRGLFHQRYVASLIDDMAAGRHDWSARLWALLWLELWFREFID
jgi:asparagine synthase (glutamine-hydrolysing)